MGGLFGGGGGGGNTQVTQNTNPPSYLQPFLTDLVGKAQGAYGKFTQGTPGQGFASPYPGQRVAGATPNDIASQNQAMQIANAMRGNSGNTMNIAGGVQDYMNNGGFMSPSNMSFTPQSNQSLTDAINATIRPITQNLTEQVLPTLKSNAIDKGAYGGSAFSNLEGQTMRNYDQSINDIAGQMLSQNTMQNNQLSATDVLSRRNAGLQGNQQMLSASQLIPQLQSGAEQQGLDIANIQGGVGQQQRGFTAADIAAAMQKYQETQQSPFAGLGNYGALLGMGTGGLGGLSQTSVPSSGFGNFAAGALGLGNAMSSGMGLLGGMGGAFNSGAAAMTELPWLSSGSGLSGIGSSLSALGGMFF